MKNRTWREVATKRMRDKRTALAYLKQAVQEYEQDGDAAALLTALRTVVDAGGGIGELSKATGLNRQTLYRTLAGKHSPRLDTLSAILRFCGLTLSLKAVPASLDVGSGAAAH